MGRRSKNQKPPTMIRQILAANLAALRDRKYPVHHNVTQRNRSLAKAAHTTLSQIQRILSLSVGTSIDLLEELAHALGVEPADLLTPYFANRMEAPSHHPGDDEGLHRRAS